MCVACATQETFEVDDHEARSPEDVDRGVTMHDAPDDEGEQRPQPRGRERDREVRHEGPVHRDGLAEHVRTRSVFVHASPTLMSCDEGDSVPSRGPPRRNFSIKVRPSVVSRSCTSS